MNNLIRIVIVMVIFASALFAETKFEQFNTYINNKQYDKALAIINAWGPTAKTDPQYYICQFNYYVNKARVMGVALRSGAVPPNTKAIEVKDPKTGEVKGYMVDSKSYDKDGLKQAIASIEEGILRFPNHYEMRFGLLWVYQDALNKEAYLQELERTLKYYVENASGIFYWNDNKEIAQPKEFIVGAVQGNFYDLIRSEAYANDLDFLQKYAELQIKYFPEDKFGYANKAACFYYANKLELAEAFYKEALRMDDKDMMMVLNIGVINRELGKKEEARKYFNFIINAKAEEQYITAAKENLKMLEAK